jgi:hypothetical protein
VKVVAGHFKWVCENLPPVTNIIDTPLRQRMIEGGQSKSQRFAQELLKSWQQKSLTEFFDIYNFSEKTIMSINAWEWLNNCANGKYPPEERKYSTVKNIFHMVFDESLNSQEFRQAIRLSKLGQHGSLFLNFEKSS